MSVVRRIRQVGEVILACFALLVIPLLPRFLTVRLADGLGVLAFAVSRKLRQIALANLDIGLGSEVSVDEKRAIARSAFKTFALVVVDLFWFSLFPRRRLSRYVHFDPSFRCYFQNRATVGVTGHFGNWEVMGQAVALAGFPSTSVATPLDNPFVDWMVRRLRDRTGQGIVPRDGALKGLLRTLRNEGRVALLLDQNTLPRDGGEFVNFFGLPVPISRAAEMLSGRTGATVVFAFCLPDARGHYTAHAVTLREQRAPDGGQHITRDVAIALETAIRRTPGAWLWMYKRWKYVAPGMERDRYPFYANHPRP